MYNPVYFVIPVVMLFVSFIDLVEPSLAESRQKSLNFIFLKSQLSFVYAVVCVCLCACTLIWSRDKISEGVLMPGSAEVRGWSFSRLGISLNLESCEIGVDQGSTGQGGCEGWAAAWGHGIIRSCFSQSSKRVFILRKV